MLLDNADQEVEPLPEPLTKASNPTTATKSPQSLRLPEREVHRRLLLIYEMAIAALQRTDLK